MAIDLTKEELLTPAEACRILPGPPPSPSTIWRWCRGTDGIALEFVKIRGRLLTSREALIRFIAARNSAAPQKVGRDPATTRRLNEQKLLE